MNISNLRKKIDQIDEKLVMLFNERAKMSLAIGQIKKKNQQGIYVSSREKAVYERVRKMNKGPMKNSGIEAVYREIMSSSLALEKDLKIAYFGSEGSFTHLAARNKFGSQVCYVPFQSIFDVFNSVEHGECDYGVVPIENSVEGAVTHTFDLLVDSDLKICAQTMLKVTHNLLSKAGSLKAIKKVYSHSQVLGQCRNWLHKNLPHAQQIAAGSTTEAAKQVRKMKNAAVIGSSFLAEIAGLKIMEKNIQDVAHNTTRFLVISMQEVSATGHDRTSIMFSIKDKVGALYAMLKPFYENKINLTKIESRPSKKKAWDYFFFVDFQGHQSESHVRKALGKLEGMCKFLKILGSYPE